MAYDFIVNIGEYLKELAHSQFPKLFHLFFFSPEIFSTGVVRCSRDLQILCSNPI